MSSTSCKSQCGSGSSRSSNFFTEDLPLQYPFHPYIDHPLVYYAQVPESCGFKQRIRGKKDNPNCFVRAFRWYTQEHNVQKSSANEREADTAGFASWLDHKYSQFLNDSCQNSVEVSRQRVTSSIQIVTNKPCKLRTDKCKRPWGRLRATSRRNGGDCHPGKRNQSFEIILQPKDLSHPASECCFQNRQDTCCETRATGISSDTEVMSRNSKLQNYATVIEGKERVLPVPENSKRRRFQVDETVVLTRTLNSTNSLNDKKHANVSCQCPEEYAGTADASTQCDLNDLNCVTPTREQPIKSNEVISTLQLQCTRKISPVDESQLATCCKIQPELKSAECDACKICLLNRNAETITTHGEDKVTTSTLSEQPKVTSNQRIIMQPPNVKIHSGTQLTISESNTSDFDVCRPCRLNSKITDTKVTYIQNNVIESSMGHQARAKSNEKMDTQRLSLSTSVICACSKENNFGIIQQSQLESNIPECKFNKNKEKTLCDQEKMKSTEKVETEKPQSYSKTSTVSPTIKITSESRHLQPESKCDVCKTCKVSNVIEAKTYDQGKAKSIEKMDTQRPCLKTSVICACPIENKFGSIHQSGPESKIPECKVCKFNKNIVKTVCDQEKIIKEWKPVGNSADIMCKCPITNKEVNQSRKASKTLPTRQATAQTSDYSICLDKTAPGCFPLLVQVMAKR